MQFSNSMFVNLREIYNLKNIMINEGLLDKNGVMYAMTESDRNYILT